MFDRSMLEPLVEGVDPLQLAALAGAFAGSQASGERVAAVEAALQSASPAWRNRIGHWIATRIVPAGILVPDAYLHWRPLVEDAMQFVFSRLSAPRLAAKLVEQIELPPGTPSEARLLVLISKMPGLQKLGQVVARNRRLAPSLRQSLSELENGMCDAAPSEIRSIISAELGPRLDGHRVEVASNIYKEGSASAVVRFTWENAEHDRERGIFKVLKPYVPACFAEDMTLLQELGKFLASRNRAYEFAIHDVQAMLAEVRQLLEHELDFVREQAALAEARLCYRSSIGIRVPRLVAPLCTPRVTAMTEEAGVKVTDACRHSSIRRDRIAGQVIEAMIAVPLFSRTDLALFHADPHAGNLLYDEPDRELVVIDWALADRMSLESRRQLAMLALMMNLRHQQGVREAICALSAADRGRRSAREHLIGQMVRGFFDRFPSSRAPGTLDAMLLLDDIALEGVHFPPSLFLFRKIVFTLDGVLHDIAGSRVPIDSVLTREFLTRFVASFGLFHAPLRLRDLAEVEWNALLYPGRRWGLVASS